MIQRPVEDLCHPDWDTTMNEEYCSLMKMILGILYLFQKEENFPDVNGSIELSMHHMEVLVTFGRHKARLVAKGFSQVEGIDYNETFFPIDKMNSIHFVLCLTASHKWHIHQMDVKYTFLQ